MPEDPTTRISVGRRLLRNVVRFVQLAIALAVPYSLVVHILNGYYLLFTGRAKGMTPDELMHAHPVAVPILNVDDGFKICGTIIPHEICAVIVVCVFLGVITGYVLQYLCQQKWVQEPEHFEECWDCDCDWWNALCWLACGIGGVLCTIIEVIRWVLRWICGWVWYVVLILVVVCSVAWIILLV